MTNNGGLVARNGYQVDLADSSFSQDEKSNNRKVCRL